MNVRVGGKLALGFALVLAFTIASALVSWTEGQRLVHDAGRLYREGVVVTEALGQAETQLQRIRGILFQHIATNADEAAFNEAESSIELETQRFFQALDRADQALDKTGQRHAKIEEVRLLYAELQQVRRAKLLPLSRQGDDEAAMEIVADELQPAFRQTLDKLNEVIEAQMTASVRIQDEVQDALKFTANVSLWSSLLAALVAALVAWWLSRSISSRISELAVVARAFGKGDLTRRAEVSQSDEITDLARAFNKMATDLVETVETQRSIAEQQRAEAQQVSHQVERYGAFLEKVASGDLAAQVGVEGGPSLAKLGENLNSMAAGLRTMTLRVHETVGALSSASAEILATSQQHAASASDSASAVAETAATVEEVSQAAQQMTQTADSMQAKADKSKRVAVNGMQAVRRTVEEMAKVRTQVSAIAEGILALSEHAQTVGHIITTVNELAEQSNLLALNAAIEATRAGEEGRAFGIVAQEIRALADQSKQATAQVRDILSTIQKATSAAVLTTEEGQKTVAAAELTVADAGKTIELLSETLEQTFDAADNIRSAADQQAQGVNQISGAMRSIDGAVRQTADSTRLIERAATDLNALSGKLQHAVAQYRI